MNDIEQLGTIPIFSSYSQDELKKLRKMLDRDLIASCFLLQYYSPYSHSHAHMQVETWLNAPCSSELMGFIIRMSCGSTDGRVVSSILEHI